MVKDCVKPIYIDIKKDNVLDDVKNSKTIQLIKKMIGNQSFGVLATNENNQSYTSLISFVSSEDLKTLAFATPIKTKKLQTIEKNDNVAILVDNRSNSEININDIAAISSLGKARILKEKTEIKKWAEILIDKHSYLDEFVNANTTAIVLVEISKYYYVTSFQEVIEWTPIKITT